MSLPYFPLYPRDFEADTSHLTLEEDGAYNRLLRLCWMTPGCSLPDDDAWIMRRMRCDADTYERVVRVVLDEFFKRGNGRVSNARLSRESDASNEKHQKRVAAGAKGGKAKYLKSKETDSSNAKAKPKQPEPEPEPVREGTDVPSRRKPSPEEGFADFWEIWPSKKNKEAARKAWRKLPIDDKRAAFSAIRDGWFERWRQASPDANPIHAATFLDARRWEDQAEPPQLRTINGGRDDRRARAERADEARREAIERVRSGEIRLGSGGCDPW